MKGETWKSLSALLAKAGFAHFAVLDFGNIGVVLTKSVAHPVDDGERPGIAPVGEEDRDGIEDVAQHAGIGEGA